MKGIGNDDQICYIIVNKEGINYDYTFIKGESKLFGLIKIEEGFYKANEYGKLELLVSIPNNMFIKGNYIIEKANLVFEYSDGESEVMYFNSDEEMFVYLKREFQGNNWRVFD